MPDVVGSSPIIHPISSRTPRDVERKASNRPRIQQLGDRLMQPATLIQRRAYALVAQLDRASDFESAGRRFESCQARSFYLVWVYLAWVM